MVTYHPILPYFLLTTKHHLSILHALEQLQRVFEHSLLIAFHCSRNLRDLLVHMTLTATSHVSLSNYPCCASRCKTCTVLIVTDEFSSHTSETVLKVKFCSSCKSFNVICLIVCRGCGLQYIGETGKPLYLRVNGLRYGIKQQKTDN